ncbi:MAG: PEGA domain-containing protein [Kiritimatiellae bacterium]|nr:PEGA domain-containing protein [Kiritimatiellia bacterium]
MIRNTMFLLCAAFSLAAVAAQEAPPPARLDITSVPEKARIFVDGKPCGLAPQSIADLPAGRHWVRAEAPGYVADDIFVRLEEGSVKRADFQLERETGLLLVTSDPAGAEVVDTRMNRTSLGSTPLFIDTLPTQKEYYLELSKTGYGAKRIRVNLENRRPVHIHEKLVNDSAVLVCTSVPSGAEITVNGTVRGKTPAEIEIPKGSATVAYRMTGYKDQTREVRLSAGERQTLAMEMQGIPASLAIATSPDRANIFLDGSYKGKSPVELDSLPPGVHTIRAEMDGYGPVTRTVHLKYGQKQTESLTLESILGRIEVISSPAGAMVLLDGKYKGTTKPSRGVKRSEVFPIADVPSGEHSLTLRLAGHQEITMKVDVKAKGVSQLQRTLKKIFTVDTEIRTFRGTYRGALVESTPEEVKLEIREGIVQSFLRSEITEIKVLPPQ